MTAKTPATLTSTCSKSEEIAALREFVARCEKGCYLHSFFSQALLAELEKAMREDGCCDLQAEWKYTWSQAMKELGEAHKVANDATEALAAFRLMVREDCERREDFAAEQNKIIRDRQEKLAAAHAVISQQHMRIAELDADRHTVEERLIAAEAKLAKVTTLMTEAWMADSLIGPEELKALLK